MSKALASVSNPASTMTTFEKIIRIAEVSKTSWDSLNLDSVDEDLQCLAAECNANANYFMKPSFSEVLDGVVSIVRIVAGIQNRSPTLLKLCNTFFQLLQIFLNQEAVRLTLRDRHKLLFLVCDFFDESLPESGIILVLSVLEATSRNMVIEWKPPQLMLLLKKLYKYITDNPQPSPSLTIAFQFLANLCYQNPSCAQIGKLDGTHKRVKEILKGFWRDVDVDKNKSSYLVGTHLVLHYEPMLSGEVLYAGYQILSTSTAHAVSNYNNNSKPKAIDILAPTFLQLKDFMMTLTKKLEPCFTISATNSNQVDDLTLCLNNQIISEIREGFHKTSLQVLKLLKPLVTKDKIDSSNHSKMLEELLQFVVTMLPSFVPVPQHLESYKEALRIANALWDFLERGSALFHACLSVYVHILELIVKKKEATKPIFEKLVSEGLFKNNVLQKLCISADISPAGVELNIDSVRLIACLTESAFAEDVSTKLDLNVLPALVNGLVEPAEILPNLKWRRTVCLLELLAIISKWHRNSDILRQLLNFVRTDRVSQQIANGILNGDDRTVRNAIAVVSTTAFEENAVSSITKGIVSTKDLCHVTIETKMLDLTPPLTQGAIFLEQALKSVPILYEKGSIPQVGDLLTWYNLKIELHNHELQLANQNIDQLQQTISRLKMLMEKQFHMMSKQVVENETKEAEMVSLQNTIAGRQKSYAVRIMSLETEATSLKTELEASKEKVGELQIVVDSLRGEREELLEKLKQETKSCSEAFEKCKTLRENNRVLKSDITRLKTQLGERDLKIVTLEAALKEKEEEARNNRIMFDNERSKLDTIRGVVGANFMNANGIPR